MLKLLRYLPKRERVLLIFTLALILLQVFFDLALPTYMSHITELVESPDSEIGEILALGAQMLLTALGSLAAALLTAFFAAHVAASFSAALRLAMYDKITAFSDKELASLKRASLLTRTTNDAMQVQVAVVLGLEVIVKAPLLCIWAAVRIALGGFGWSLLAVGGTLLLLLVCALAIGLSMPHFRRMQRLADDLSRITREQVSGLHTIRALAGERFEEARFERTNEALTETHLYTAHTLSLLNPAIQLINSLLTLGVYFVGMLLINAAVPGARLGIFSECVAFLSYVLRIVSAFTMVATASTLLSRAAVSLRRIREVLDTPLLVVGGEDTPNEGARGELRFCGVSLFHDGAEEAVLRDVSFSVREGELFGILGVSGSGKSAVASLIPRFRDPDKGAVLLNGLDVRSYGLSDLRARIGYVTQEPQLFSATLRENIAMGDGGGEALGDEELSVLLHAVGAEELVASLPQREHTRLHTGGVNLSGGEAQRIAMARALCGHPEVIVFDDSFSFFDTPTADRLRASLADYCKGVTRIVVAQRIASLRGADRILVLDRGCVVGLGTHAELMESCALYRDIAAAQGSGVSAHG